MGDLSDKLAFKRELPRYLRDLAVLLGRRVEAAELLSVEETQKIRVQANQVARQPLLRFEVPFGAKEEERFDSFLKRLADANPSDAYLWTPAANICGVLRPVPLSAVNFSFPFDLNPEGIVVILTSDLNDQLLLDYSLGEEGEPMLEVETSGKHWGSVAY
jgi:hypothetical protein